MNQCIYEKRPSHSFYNFIRNKFDFQFSASVSFSVPSETMIIKTFHTEDPHTNMYIYILIIYSSYYFLLNYFFSFMEHYVNNKSFLLDGFGGKLKEAKEGEGEDEIFSFVKQENVV